MLPLKIILSARHFKDCKPLRNEMESSTYISHTSSKYYSFKSDIIGAKRKEMNNKSHNFLQPHLICLLMCGIELVNNVPNTDKSSKQNLNSSNGFQPTSQFLPHVYYQSNTILIPDINPFNIKVHL